VHIDNSSSLEPQQLTLSLSFRGTSSPGVAKYLLSKGGQNCTAASYAIHTSWNGGIGFYVWDGEGQVGAGSAPATVWDGKWHNASATWDGTRALLFIDGVKYDGAVGSATIDYATSPTNDGFLGAYKGSCDLNFTGDIDNVMVFSKALPIAEIWKKWAGSSAPRR
jgi:Concanavalin A-like lectin/glucanases superfamily